MATANLHIHQVSSVSVTSERLGNKTLQRVVIYGDDGIQIRLTLYGLDSAKGDIPYTFTEVEEAKDEPPPALKLEMERDLKGAVAQGRVWGEVFDNLFAPRK